MRFIFQNPELFLRDLKWMGFPLAIEAHTEALFEQVH